MFSEPDPDDQVAFDGTRVSEDERGGFDTQCGILKRHAWLAVGEGLWLFDPTGHQFDGVGRATLDRYWHQRKGGRISLLEWRAQRLGVSDISHDEV